MALKAAPSEYAFVLTSEQEKRGTGVELSHLRVVMNKYYRAVYKNKSASEKDDEDEMTLAAQTQSRGGNQGGTKNRGNRTPKFNGNCNLCGKHGHKAVDCWSNPKNKDKRPNWFKPKEEVNSAAQQERKSEELQLVNISWGKYAETFAEEDEIDYKSELLQVKEEGKALDVAHGNQWKQN